MVCSRSPGTNGICSARDGIGGPDQRRNVSCVIGRRVSADTTQTHASRMLVTHHVGDAATIRRLPTLVGEWFFEMNAAQNIGETGHGEGGREWVKPV